VSVRRPDGGTDVLLFARDMPIEWPTPYIFREPVTVEPGARIRVTAYYDNPLPSPQPGGFRVTFATYR